MKIRKNKKLGMTLVEILIVGLLGYIVSTTAIDFIFSSSNSGDNREIEGKLLQDGMLASSFIANDLYRAGDLDYGVSPFLKSPFEWSLTGQRDSVNDEIATSFYNHGDAFICLPSGNSGVGTISSNHYFVKNKILHCGANDGDTSKGNEIINNVERFNVVFGVDLTGNGIVDRFVDHNTARAINDDVEKRVVAVRFGLLLAQDSKNSEITKKEFTLVDGERVEYSDNKIYKYFERTVLLRNML